MIGHKRGSYSLEHRKAISESLKGEKHPNYGKPAIQRTKIVEISNVDPTEEFLRDCTFLSSAVQHLRKLIETDCK